jgi:hypothetical protein
VEAAVVDHAESARVGIVVVSRETRRVQVAASTPASAVRDVRIVAATVVDAALHSNPRRVLVMRAGPTTRMLVRRRSATGSWKSHRLLLSQSFSADDHEAWGAVFFVVSEQRPGYMPT